MGPEIILVKCFQMGGVAVISALVESGLESAEKTGWAKAIRIISFAGIGFVAVSAIWELMNYVGSVFLS